MAYVYGLQASPHTLGAGVRFAGCVIHPGSPQWVCEPCGHQWGDAYLQRYDMRPQEMTEVDRERIQVLGLDTIFRRKGYDT